MSLEQREELAKTIYGMSLRTLEQVPQKVFTFIQAAGTNLTIRAALQRRGYTPQVHQQGWTLLHTAGNVSPQGEITAIDSEVANAVAELDAMDRDMIELIDATLSRRFPDQAKVLIDGLVPATGMRAVYNIDHIVRGAKALRSAPDRKATRKQDKAALDLLAERGLTTAEFDRLAQLVAVATSAPEVEPLDPGEGKAADERYVRARGDLWVWYNEWSRIAKTVLKRRDYLMQLGLAHRSSPAHDDGDEETPETSAGNGNA